MSEAIQRIVRKIEPPNGPSPSGGPGPFSEFLEVKNIILLGDPGAGKTYTFNAAAKEENAKFLPVRNFLAVEGKGYEGTTIYLDGLDEFRSRVGDKNAIIEVIKLLNRFGKPQFRLSCRVADWLGETDLSLFKTYFGNDPYVVLLLEPLNDREIATILWEKGIGNPEEFVGEAKGRGLEGLLGNPQTLIMLTEVVDKGIWPKTKRELFEKSIQKLLTEHNRARTGPGPGQYTAEELIAPAGAACASILISGVAGISLSENSGRADFPTYRSIPFNDLAKVQACLMRRAFSVVDVDNEAVSYIHRTIAEFLAAKWLADRVRNGYPIRRLQSLIGIEGQPATELRGLHAWLSVLLHEHAPILINNNPYGVLIYGDSASLSPSDRQALMSALETLSKIDPWFRSGDWSDQSLGALSGSDMVESFRRILFDPNCTPHLKSVVLDAIRNGPSLPQLLDDLRKILGDPEAPYRYRSSAMDALFRVVPEGAGEIVEIFNSKLSSDPASARLRAEILERIYPGHFSPADVVSVFKDYLASKEEIAVGELWGITQSLPEEALPDILDKLCDLQWGGDLSETRVDRIQIKTAFSKLVSRALNFGNPVEVNRVWRWLKAANGICRQRSFDGKDEEIRNWLSQNRQLVLEMFKIAYEELDSKKSKWRFPYEFQRITYYSIPGEDLARFILEILKSKETITDKDHFLYEICGNLILASDSPQIGLFEEYFEFAENHIELRGIRSTACQWVIEDWRKEENVRSIKYMRKREKGRESNRRNLEATKEGIKCGQLLYNLGFLAGLYFGRFSDIDRKLSPIERLRVEIGDELLAIALEGFSAIIKRNDLPSPTEVAELSANGRYCPWWYAVLAGLDLAWQKEGALDKFPDLILNSALAISVECPTFEQEGNENREPLRGWKEQLFKERPDLVEGVLEDMARVGLRHQKEYISALYSITQNDGTKGWRGKVILRLLFDFPSARPQNLRDMILAALSDSKCHKELNGLANSIVSSQSCLESEQIAMWVIVKFLLSEDSFQDPFIEYLHSHEWAIWILIDIAENVRAGDKSKPIDLSIEKIETLIKIVGGKFKNVHLPRGEWEGNHNPWDASEFVLKQINRLSAVSDLGASRTLKRLVDNNSLASYRDHLRHALVSQATIRRGAEYKQPSWPEVTEAFRGGRPANVADLFALILDYLETIKTEIRHSNTDTYKSFWRCDSWGAVDRPEIEDICRDRLIELIRPRLLPLDLRVEPEGHMAQDKRADIVILPPPGQKLPLELKRDTHEDLWGACENQLERLYARDPEAEGYGIYAVFWFGAQRDGRLPAPPAGINPPATARDLETALRSMIPSDKRHCLEAVVIDVSPPEQGKNRVRREKTAKSKSRIG